jgi:hypothetical protein
MQSHPPRSVWSCTFACEGYGTTLSGLPTASARAANFITASADEQSKLDNGTRSQAGRAPALLQGGTEHLRHSVRRLTRGS